MPCGADSRIDYVTYGLRENIPAMRKLLASGWTDSAISNYYAIPQYTVRRLRRLNDKSVLDYYVSAVCARFESPEYMTMDPLTPPRYMIRCTNRAAPQSSGEWTSPLHRSW